MKKTYIEPHVKWLSFEVEDVIASSADDELEEDELPYVPVG